MSELKTLRLVREASNPQGTEGRIYHDTGRFDTLEPPAPQHDATHPRIPPGTYLAKKIGSPRFPDRYVLQDVPGRAGIVIHPGNYAGNTAEGWQSDSDGCILIGRRQELLNTSHTRQKALILSRSTLAAFEEIMQHEDFWLTVFDPVDG